MPIPSTVQMPASIHHHRILYLVTQILIQRSVMYVWSSIQVRKVFYQKETNCQYFNILTMYILVQDLVMDCIFFFGYRILNFKYPERGVKSPQNVIKSHSLGIHFLDTQYTF